MNGRVFFGIILMLVGITVLIIMVARLVDISSDSNNDPLAPSLSSQITDESVLTMEKRGRITADENHYGYRVIIDDDRRILETYQGYEKAIVERHIFDNNQTAFGQFVEALSDTGLKGLADQEKYGDATGLCPFGTLNTYQLNNAENLVVNQYQSSCGDNSTSAARLESLFVAQIPDFNRLLNVRL